MAVIRWVFSNMLWVFAAAVVAVGVLYWDTLRPEFVKVGLVSDAPEPTAQAPAIPTAANTTAAPTAAPTPAPVAKPAPQTAAAQPTTAAPMASRMPMGRAATPAKSLPDDLKKDWAAARQAYWARDLDKAITLYEALTKAHPDQPDIQGELGNIYLMQGRRDEAAARYAAAGETLLKEDQPLAANKALMPLGMLAPEKARALRQKIFDASQNQKK